MKRRICSYDLAAVPENGYVLTTDGGEVYLCDARCLAVWALSLATKLGQSEEPKTTKLALKVPTGEELVFETIAGLAGWASSYVLRMVANPVADCSIESKESLSVFNESDPAKAGVQETPRFAKEVANASDVNRGYWRGDLWCRFANVARKTWVGKPSNEMFGISIEEFLGQLYETCRPHIAAVLNGEPRTFERKELLADGTLLQSLVSFHPDLRTGIGDGFIMQHPDIVRKKQLESELEACEKRANSLVSHDYLTGLPNRFSLDDTIGSLLLQAEASGKLLGLTLLDIDGFKKVNETYGHDVGDGILREIARRIKGALCPPEMVIRIGGDEFLFLTPGVQNVLRRIWRSLVFSGRYRLQWSIVARHLRPLLVLEFRFIHSMA